MAARQIEAELSAAARAERGVVLPAHGYLSHGNAGLDLPIFVAAPALLAAFDAAGGTLDFRASPAAAPQRPP